MNMSYSAPIMIGPSTSSTSILTKTSSSSLKSSYSSNSSSSYYSSTLMSCEFLSSLSKDLSLLLEDDVQDYNMIINVGQEPDFKTFRAHSMILRVRSPYFRAALLSEWTKTENNIIIFNKPNISPIVFELVLKFIYTGSLSLDDYDTPVLLDLLRAADELCIQELIDFVQDYLLCYKTGWIQRNFSTTYKLIHIHGDSFYKLKNYCNEIIRNDPELVFHSEDFSTLEEQALIKLLMRDDLGKEEIILWDHLVKWGASTSGIKTLDLTKWTYKEWELLSEKLENLIPLIRFLHISSGDFYKKVKPFARILPIELYEDLLQYYLVPNHQPSLELMQPKRSNFNSVIIERKQVAMIASWIDKKDLLVNKYNNKKRVNINNNPNYQSSFYEPWENPYEFKLLLRGSRDGFTGLDFHSKCDSKGATITIMKVNGSSELYGGYTPIDWLSQNTWGYCKESFIFCLDDKDLDKSIISRVKDPSRAINYYNNYGPSFGTGDLKMTGNFKNESRCCCQHGDYELPIRANSDDIHFSVDEYEVFQIIPRRRRKRNMDLVN